MELDFRATVDPNHADKGPKNMYSPSNANDKSKGFVFGSSGTPFRWGMLNAFKENSLDDIAKGDMVGDED
ncbi:uncharacterized protein CCR75_008582 [Bremia lactucae]|uniref:Uncharacterized protein n=1 Tax=Bremia lactucae TaxID=4779 RepID=A0A976NZS8_BRELC|nr:hypothetical protein CCR75_008582 [Bremia lactucae]